MSLRVFHTFSALDRNLGHCVRYCLERQLLCSLSRALSRGTAIYHCVHHRVHHCVSHCVRYCVEGQFIIVFYNYRVDHKKCLGEWHIAEPQVFFSLEE